MTNISDGKAMKETLTATTDLKKRRGYWKLKEETLDRTAWRTGCGRGYGPVLQGD